MTFQERSMVPPRVGHAEPASSLGTPRRVNSRSATCPWRKRRIDFVLLRKERTVARPEYRRPQRNHLGKQIRRTTSDKMPCAINRRWLRIVNGSGAEHCGDGASTISCGGRCRDMLGIVGRGPGLGAMGLAGFGRDAAGSRRDRLFAPARVVREKTSESDLNAFPPWRRRVRSIL